MPLCLTRSLWGETTSAPCQLRCLSLSVILCLRTPGHGNAWNPQTPMRPSDAPATPGAWDPDYNTPGELALSCTSPAALLWNPTGHHQRADPGARVPSNLGRPSEPGPYCPSPHTGGRGLGAGGSFAASPANGDGYNTQRTVYSPSGTPGGAAPTPPLGGYPVYSPAGTPGGACTADVHRHLFSVSHCIGGCRLSCLLCVTLSISISIIRQCGR